MNNAMEKINDQYLIKDEYRKKIRKEAMDLNSSLNSACVEYMDTLEEIAIDNIITKITINLFLSEQDPTDDITVIKTDGYLRPLKVTISYITSEDGKSKILYGSQY